MIVAARRGIDKLGVIGQGFIRTAFSDTSMRHTYIVSYDIADPKRLRRVYRICQDYGNHLQYSVFECDLSATERVDLESKLRSVIHHELDQVLFIGLGPAENRGGRTITALGQAYHHFDQPCYVV